MGVMYENSGVNLAEAHKLAGKLNNLGGNFNLFSGDKLCGGLKISHCCDGIGTKIIPLYSRKLYKNIAVDLAAANLNDIATQNVRAFAFLDYIAVNELDSAAVSEIIFELKKILAVYDCELLGGETSEMPAILRENTIDICGFLTGIKKDTVYCIRDGDCVIGLTSNGIHANGFSLIRKLYSQKLLSEDEFIDCLKPSYIYYGVLRKLWDNNFIKSGANITGGGILSNLNRVIPQNCTVDLDYNKIPSQNIYKKLYSICGEEMFEVFNCGVGFCIVAEKSRLDDIFNICSEFNPFLLGKVVKK